MKSVIAILGATAACLAAALPAAEPPKESQVYVYVTYFHCNSAIVEDADKAVSGFFKGELDGMLGHNIISWGWLAKNTGGEWSRAGYLSGPSVTGVLQAVAEFQGKSDAKPPVKKFENACSSSEDYIWHRLAGNDARGHRGNASFSTYYVCDQSREQQADALVKHVIGPMYDKLVADHKLTTWMWAEHIVGGKYRRLATMTAPTVDALVEAREAIVAAAEHDPIDEAMTSICGSHQDFIWDVREQGPN
jgi:hypothetical protein